MFALAVAPMLFLCAYIMAAYKKTAGLGFVAGLYFANVAGFQDRMVYDPVGFLNASIAVALPIATAGVLFAIVAPDTPQTARRRFIRAARKAFDRIARARPPIGLTEFEFLHHGGAGPAAPRAPARTGRGRRGNRGGHRASRDGTRTDPRSGRRTADACQA